MITIRYKKYAMQKVRTTNNEVRTSYMHARSTRGSLVKWVIKEKRENAFRNAHKVNLIKDRLNGYQDLMTGEMVGGLYE
jgi:hypothetical protein